MLDLIIGAVGGLSIGYMWGRTTEWRKVLDYLRDRDIDRDVYLGVVVDEHRGRRKRERS